MSFLGNSFKSSAGRVRVSVFHVFVYVLLVLVEAVVLVAVVVAAVEQALQEQVLEMACVVCVVCHEGVGEHRS